MRWTAVWMPAGKIPGVFSLCPRHHQRIFIPTEDNKRWWDVIHHNRNSIKGTVHAHGGVIGPHSAFKLHVIHVWMCNIKLVIDTSAQRTWKIKIQVYAKCKETNRCFFCRLLTLVKYYTAEKWWILSIFVLSALRGSAVILNDLFSIDRFCFSILRLQKHASCEFIVFVRHSAGWGAICHLSTVNRYSLWIFFNSHQPPQTEKPFVA